MFCSQRKSLVVLDALGWTNDSELELEQNWPTKNTRSVVTSVRKQTKMREFELLRLFMDDNWIDSILTGTLNPNLQRLNNYSARKRVKKAEFWVFFGRLIIELLEASPAGSRLKFPMELLHAAFKSEMKLYRYDAIKAAMTFDLPNITKVLQHNLDVLQKETIIGDVVAMDETILATVGTRAKDLGMLVYIPGKPHPAGILVRGICSRMTKRNCVLFLHGAPKQTNFTCSPMNGGIYLVSELEARTKRSHMVVIDGAFPCEQFMSRTGREFRS